MTDKQSPASRIAEQYARIVSETDEIAIIEYLRLQAERINDSGESIQDYDLLCIHEQSVEKQSKIELRMIYRLEKRKR